MELPDFMRFRIAWQSSMLSVMRMMIGLLFMEHGLAKVFDFPHQPNHVPFVLHGLNPGAQGLIELVGGFLLLLGLFTRPVAFILAGDMAVAYFMAHAPKSFFPLLNGGEGCRTQFTTSRRRRGRSLHPPARCRRRPRRRLRRCRCG